MSIKYETTNSDAIKFMEFWKSKFEIFQCDMVMVDNDISDLNVTFEFSPKNLCDVKMQYISGCQLWLLTIEIMGSVVVSELPLANNDKFPNVVSNLINQLDY